MESDQEEESLLRLIERRYDQEQYYTLYGMRQLVFVNPQLEIDHLSGEEVSQFFITAPISAAYDAQHVFGFSQLVLRDLLCTNQSQTVIFAGDDQRGIQTTMELFIHQAIVASNHLCCCNDHREAVRLFHCQFEVLKEFAKAPKVCDIEIEIGFHNGHFNGIIYQVDTEIKDIEQLGLIQFIRFISGEQFDADTEWCLRMIGLLDHLSELRKKIIKFGSILADLEQFGFQSDCSSLKKLEVEFGIRNPKSIVDLVSQFLQWMATLLSSPGKSSSSISIRRGFAQSEEWAIICVQASAESGSSLFDPVHVTRFLKHCNNPTSLIITQSEWDHLIDLSTINSEIAEILVKNPVGNDRVNGTLRKELDNYLFLSDYRHFINPVVKQRSNNCEDDDFNSFWSLVCILCTFWMPEILLSRYKNIRARMAWREKFSLCLLIFLVSAVVLLLSIGCPILLCPQQDVIGLSELKSLPTPHCIVYGRVYDLGDFAKIHTMNSATPKDIFSNTGKDVSFLFPPPKPKVQRAFSWLNVPFLITRKRPEKQCNRKADTIVVEEGPLPYIHTDDVWLVMDSLHSVSLGFTSQEIEIMKQEGKNIRVNDDVVTLDGTAIGVVDYRGSSSCLIANSLLTLCATLLLAVMIFKFFAALQIRKQSKEIDHKMMDRFVIFHIPCYSESEDTLRRTIDSVASSRYEDERKLMVIVADGLVTGSGNDRSTPHILSEIFGVCLTLDGSGQIYESLGCKSRNYAQVYSGMYSCLGHLVPYLLIVKIGTDHEAVRPGNRGKRDSQAILLRYLSKIHYQEAMDPLEFAIHNHIHKTVGIDPHAYEFLMMIDADTQVDFDALSLLLRNCINDRRIMGICGETRLLNETKSFITMMQVYEYFISHNLTKSFESLFGCVTCLPGCFSLYRICTPKEMGAEPLLIKKELLASYLKANPKSIHEQNLLTLGEDRYLTTLVLRYFPTYKCKYDPTAVCYTQAPETFSVLLSQRRRWINSTIHNLYELLLNPVSSCFSMRFVVFFDLFQTLLMPASVIYIAYLVYEAFQWRRAPIISLCLMASMYGLQSLLFLINGRWRYFGWLLVYIILVPVSGFIIPIYAYWHFDDFSWGDTRKILGDDSLEDEGDMHYPIPLIPWNPHVLDAETIRFKVRELIQYSVDTGKYQRLTRRELKAILIQAYRLEIFKWDSTLNRIIDEVLCEIYQ